MNEVKAKPVRRHLRWPARALIFALVAVLVFGGVVLALGLSGRAISAPQWVVEEIEARANTGLAGRATVADGSDRQSVGSHSVFAVEEPKPDPLSLTQQSPLLARPRP